MTLILNAERVTEIGCSFTDLGPQFRGVLPTVSPSIYIPIPQSRLLHRWFLNLSFIPTPLSALSPSVLIDASDKVRGRDSINHLECECSDFLLLLLQSDIIGNRCTFKKKNQGSHKLNHSSWELGILDKNHIDYSEIAPPQKVASAANKHHKTNPTFMADWIGVLTLMFFFSTPTSSKCNFTNFLISLVRWRKKLLRSSRT